MILQTILRSRVGSDIINISLKNIVLFAISLEGFFHNCQAAFCCYEH